MKTTNNATIFEQIKMRGYMTEKEMLLLKSRSNKAQKDLFQYDEFNEYIPLSEEWTEKGLKWLKSLLKKTENLKRGKISEIGRLKSSRPQPLPILLLFASMITGTDGLETIFQFTMWQEWSIESKQAGL